MGALSREGQPLHLKRFCLSEVPLDIRLRAAKHLARVSASAIKPELAGSAGLLAAVLDFRARDGSTLDPEVIEHVARFPSERSYWIPLEAWERVMG